MTILSDDEICSGCFWFLAFFWVVSLSWTVPLLQMWVGLSCRTNGEERSQRVSYEEGDQRKKGEVGIKPGVSFPLDQWWEAFSFLTCLSMTLLLWLGLEGSDGRNPQMWDDITDFHSQQSMTDDKGHWVWDLVYQNRTLVGNGLTGQVSVGLLPTNVYRW